MGFGSYSASDWSKLKNSRNLSSDNKVNEIFKRTSCNPKFDPKYIGTRECFDSSDHPNTIPIVVGLDVTASMGYLAVKVASEALNDLIMKLYSTGAVEDPALMCAAYGDYQDRSPLQVTQFESDIRIAEQLLDLYFENGGQGEVAISCLWEFLAKHTNIDAINKRQEKGFLFTIGDDAEIRNEYIDETIERVIGDKPVSKSKRSSLDDMLSEVQKKFHVFHIMIGGIGNEDLLAGHKICIGKTEVDLLPQIILSTIQMQKGKKLDEILNQWDEIQRPTIRKALSDLALTDVGGAITL